MTNRGVEFCPRDEFGRRVPRQSTLSRRIYDLMAQGMAPADIAVEVGASQNTVRVLIYKIRHPDKANERAKLER